MSSLAENKEHQQTVDIKEPYRISYIKIQKLDSKNYLVTTPTRALLKLHPAIIEFFLKFKNIQTFDQHIDEHWKKIPWNKRKVLYSPLLNCFWEYYDEIKFSKNMFIEIIYKICIKLLSEGLFETVNYQIKSASVAIKKPSVNIITNERIDYLKQNIQSQLNCFSSNSNESYEINIFDDSRNQKLSPSFDSHKNIKINYYGIKKKQQIQAKLTHAGFDKQILDYLLFSDRRIGGTYGANRNFFLLKNAGNIAYSTDDDIFANLHKPKDTNENLIELTSSWKGYWKTFSSREEVLNQVQSEHFDYLNTHSSILDKNVYELIQNKTIDSKNLILDRTLCELLNGKVKISSSGIYGDSGSTMRSQVFFLSGDSEDEALYSFEQYQKTLNSKEIIKHYKHLCISNSGSFMAGSHSVDLSDLAPPFFPNFRNEDGLFWEIWNLVESNIYSAYLPYMHYHNPPENRNTTYNIDDEYINVDTELALSGLLLKGNFHQNNISGNMKYLSTQILNRFNISDDQFQQLILDYYISKVSSAINELEVRLESKDKKRPNFWKKDLKKLIESYKNNSIKRFKPYPDDIQTDSNSDGISLFKTFLINYAKALQMWPELFQYCKQHPEIFD